MLSGGLNNGEMHKSNTSRLDTMKRQFNKKISRGLHNPHKIIASATSGNLNATKSTHSNDDEGTGHCLTGEKLQTLSASNFAVKGHGSTSNGRNVDKTYAMRDHSTTQSGCLEKVSNRRQGREKVNPAQMLKSASARQVVGNVLMEEMKTSSVNKARVQTRDGSSTVLTSNYPAVGSLTNSSFACPNIREKLKQNHRHNVQVSSSSKREQYLSEQQPNNESTDTANQKLTTDDTASQKNSRTTSNELILNQIRQKGPMIAKRSSQPNVVEDGDAHASATSSTIPKHTSNISKPRSKVSSRPGSPRSPRRKVPSVSTGRTSPFSKRAPSPSGKGRGRNPSPVRRPPSPSTDGISPYSPEATAKKVNRVLKARLYLLQQNGPNSFRIGGDSPEHKYLVIVGPQTCNCGRGQFCVHVLFVMLRVFQLEPTSNLLWRRTLKNYEVEMLFKSYHERCNSRIAPKKKSRVQRLVSHLANGTDRHQDGSSNSDDQSSSKGEEENCPICLLQMVDGESVTVCEVGCRNKLHTHCVNIWAEECKRNGGALKCPLCRIIWKPANASISSAGSLLIEIPPEYVELADDWIQVFGRELVSFLFSTRANVRETALRRLSHDITGALLTNNQTSANEERHSDDSDSSRESAENRLTSTSSISSNACLASCCSILAMVCADPEYRLYITALQTLRSMLAYTQCRTEEDVSALQRLLVPVIEAILLKCADSNRRTVQLSVSTVMELCRGQSGELAVGREIVSGGAGTLGIGNVSYFLSFLKFDSGRDTPSWQWMLGRLNALGEVFREFRSELSPSDSINRGSDETTVTIQNLLHISNFASSCLRSTTQPRVLKVSRRNFLNAYTLATSSPELIIRLEEMVGDLPIEVAQKLQKKMSLFKSITAKNPENSRKLIEERFKLSHSHSDDNLIDGDVLDIHSPQAPPSGLQYPMAHADDVNNYTWYHHQHHDHAHETHYPANSYRVPQQASYAWTPRSRDKGVINEPSHHHHNHCNHPPSPCTVTHPPTPPPSSVDTANLDAAIEVSLFRPIRCVSPGRDSSKPETQVPTSSNNADEMFLEDFDDYSDSHLTVPPDNNLPLRCFSYADALAQGSLRPRPVTNQGSASQNLEQASTSSLSERPARPSLLRLKSESSAFQDMLSPRTPRAQTTMELGNDFPGFESRDRISSHESTSSILDEYQQSSERRRSVRELADSINRKEGHKHTKKVSNRASNLPVNAKVLTSSKQNNETGDFVTERHESSQHDSNINDGEDRMVKSNSYNGVLANSKPISLKASAAIERRGTVERYRDGLKIGTNATPNRKVILQHKVLAEEGQEITNRRRDHHISPFLVQPQADLTRTPARGILKNGSSQSLACRATEKVVTKNSENYSAAEDSGFGSDSVQNSASTVYGSSKTQYLLQDLETLNSLGEHYEYTDISEDYYLDTTKSDRSNNQSNKSNSLPKDISPPKICDSPTFFQSDDENDDIASNRCPSAPAASSLHENASDQPTLVPLKDESSSEQEQPVTNTMPHRPRTLAQKKYRSRMKKHLNQLSSSVEDLDESDYSIAEKTPVTFKSEIGVQTPDHFCDLNASTPTSSSYHKLSMSYEKDLAMQCNCRMQIAEEEDKLFAHTLAVSYVQDGLPLVPHLSFTDDDVDIVRIQDENTDNRYEYRENKQWSKGAQIGLGAFSACYQARDIFTGTLMAVKQVNHVRCSPIEEQQVLHVITEEITLMRRLCHPNIVRLHGVTREGPLYNIFVEWCAGGSVSTLLSHYGSFNEKVIVNYSLQMLRGLAYLHEQLLIHRDIKGANLLVDSTGQRLRLSDFGAAARLASKGTGAGEFQGQLLGTIAFMAPEVLRGEQYGRSCDVWSAGCVVTEMATGKPPWEADKHSNHLALIFKIASAPSVPPIPESLSPALKDLCRRCLQANPRDRPLASELLKHPVFIKW